MISTIHEWILRHSSEVELIKGKFGWTVSLLDLR